MRLQDLQHRNQTAIDKIEEFRADRPAGKLGALDARFHQFKNRHPYFGYVDVTVGPAQFLMFSGNDDLIALAYFWHGPDSFESMSLSLWAEHCRKARSIFDVGAFTGVYGLSAALINQSAKVHCFEPVRRTYGRLLMNVQVNALTNRVSCVNLGLSNSPGEAVINQFRGENILGNGASILAKDIPATDDSERIVLTTLDAYQAIPDLIKIDVEGAELLVLEGGVNVFQNHRPTTFIEVTPETSEQVYSRLREFGYEVRLIDDARQTVQPFDGKVDGVRNLIATPLRKVREVRRRADQQVSTHSARRRDVVRTT